MDKIKNYNEYRGKLWNIKWEKKMDKKINVNKWNKIIYIFYYFFYVFIYKWISDQF